MLNYGVNDDGYGIGHSGDGHIKRGMGWVLNVMALVNDMMVKMASDDEYGDGALLPGDDDEDDGGGATHPGGGGHDGVGSTKTLAAAAAAFSNNTSHLPSVYHCTVFN